MLGRNVASPSVTGLLVVTASLTQMVTTLGTGSREQRRFLENGGGVADWKAFPTPSAVE